MRASNDNAVIISVNDACTMTSLSRTALFGLRSRGDFPSPVRLGERRIGFVRAEVEAWIDQRIAARAA